MQHLYLILLCSCLVGRALAAPLNDDCADAVLIENPVDWCSGNAAYTTVAATAEIGQPPPSCFAPASGVWFTFVAQAPAVSISVLSSGQFGNMVSPALALYRGGCGGLTEVGCAPGSFFSGSVQLLLNGLTLGESYYIYVQSTVQNGPFTLCVDNFADPQPPSADCPAAAVLCTKDPFVVPFIDGPGDDPTEANDADCISSFNVEMFSTWMVWTAGEAGSLTFELDPINPQDDLDFAVYRFPNGPGDCSGKELLRCMASSCIGPTGLNDTAVDFSEPPNCNPAVQDNFLAALQMQEGETYGIMVNNFSQSGFGFGIRFGGTGTFAGPPEDFLILPAPVVCRDSALTFLSPEGSGPEIIEWAWEFGQGASPPVAVGNGPHEITYSEPSTQFVQLRRLSDQGCIATDVLEIEVICCEAGLGLSIEFTAPSCTNSTDGVLAVSATAADTSGWSFLWSDGEEGAMRDSLAAGSYELVVTNEAGCPDTLRFELTAPEPLAFDTLINRPSCDAGTDGSITLLANGGTSPYSYSWEGAGFGASNVLDSLPAGDYEVVVRDSNACTDSLLISLRELELLLDPQVQSSVNPSCAGSADGRISVVVSNGLPPYQYDFADGEGYVGQNVLDSLAAGAYTVAVIDANLCEGNFFFELENPPALGVLYDALLPSCFGQSDGVLAAAGQGGTPAYTYAWSTGASGSELQNLPGGAYGLTLTDANGCELADTFLLTEPSVLQLSVDSLLGPRCAEEQSGFAALSVEGGSTPYQYEAGNSGLQQSPLFDGLPAGTIVFAAVDANGCRDTVQAALPAPPQIIVDAGPGDTLVLGEDAQLSGSAEPAGLQLSWTPDARLDCPDCLRTGIRQPPRSGWYTLSARDGRGCTAADSAFVAVELQYPLYLPNAFSPNGDGRNDLWQAFGGAALDEILLLQVYDRWGGLVYEQENPADGVISMQWDGKSNNKNLPAGVYTCTVEARFIDGVIRRFATDVSLLR